MDSLHLSLRHKKLLNFLQSQTDYISGTELARYLHVSPRTVRSDISEINKALAGDGICIHAQKRRGYHLDVENPHALAQLKQLGNTFLTKEDRIRYLAFTLCLSDIPVNIYDLEDEMYVSHTTLEHDIHLLKVKYVLAPPYIALIQKKGFLEFEADERKRRAILNHLFHEDWNYNTRDNAYYSYEFLDHEQIELISKKVDYYLNKYSVILEDTDLVSLNLAIAIMHRRSLSGHALDAAETPVGAGGLDADADGALHAGAAGEEPSGSADGAPDVNAASCATPAAFAGRAVDELLDDLECSLNFHIAPAERAEIYDRTVNTQLLDANQLTFATVGRYFSEKTIRMADRYLQRLQKLFDLDLTKDEDFYITLLQLLRYLQLPYHSFNTFQINPDMARNQLMIEFEIAEAFQEIALETLGYYLNHTELMYLAFTISGAMEYLHQLSRTKFRTAICCHLNLAATWALKRKVLAGFDKFLDVVALLPVNSKQIFDFDTVDLVLTTVKKSITDCPNTQVLYISPFMAPADDSKIENYIARKRLEQLYAPELPAMDSLLTEAFWHEQIAETDKLAIFNMLISDFISNGYVHEDFHKDVLRRESISTFAIQPGMVLMYSLKPSERTVLSVATLEHRITWNSYKIRTVIMAAFRPQDATAVFMLMNRIYGNYDDATVSQLKTKREIMDYFRN